MGKTIGIDLGTTNSVAAVMEGGTPTVIPNTEGQRTTPSVVNVKGEEKMVGGLARRQAVLNATSTIASIKRFMGHSKQEVQSEIQKVAYPIVEKGNGVAVEVEGKVYTPEEISALILRKLKEDAEKFLGGKVTSAVITVPAYFNDSQRQATKNAGAIAGLEVLRIINEPTAAALAYGLDKKGKDETILVFDLGGGTFDVSILEVGEGVFEVKSTSGDSHLGGDDFDRKIVEWLASNFKAENGIDLKQDKQALQRLTEASEKAKIELSTLSETNISLPFITADQNGPKHLEIKLTRSKFEELVGDLLTRIKVPVQQALKDAEISAGQIDEVVLVGGSSRIPAVQQLVKDLTGGKEPNQTVNPDEVVAIGAAIQAGVLAGDVKDVVLLDVTPLTLGIETKGGVSSPLIERNTTIPTRKSEIYSTAESNQTSVEIHVLQGERPMARDNKSLGKFQLTGIPPAPAGIPQIEVTFDIDANGILSVTAKEKTTGKEQKISITATTNLDESEIDRMVKEAEANAQEDAKRKGEIEEKNQIDSLTYAGERLIGELPEAAPSDLKSNLEAKITETRQAIKDESPIETLREKKGELEKELYALQTWLQANPQTGNTGSESTNDPNSANSGTSNNNDDEVIDAEYKPTD